MELIVLLLLVGVLFGLEDRLYVRQWARGLHYECRFSTDEAYEGDEITLIETITNGKALPLAWAKAEITASRWLAFAGSQSTIAGDTRFVPSFFVLRGHHRVVRSWKVRCLRRGVYHIDKTVIVTTDLLGRRTFSLPVRLHAQLTVLPRPRALEECVVSPQSLSGARVVPRRLFTDPFFVNGVRPYTPWDSANRIHWTATAKAGEIMVRSNDSTSDQTVAVLLNMQTRADEGAAIRDAEDVERGIRAAASVIAETARTGFPVQFWANGGGADGESTTTGCGAGEEFALDLLRVLAQLHVTKSENFARYADQVRGRILSTDMVLITAYVDDALAEFVRERQEAGVHVQLLLLRVADAAPEGCDCAQYIEEPSDASAAGSDEEVHAS